MQPLRLHLLRLVSLLHPSMLHLRGGVDGSWLAGDVVASVDENVLPS